MVAVPERERLAGLSRSYLFESLSLEALAPLARVATTRGLVRGAYLWRAGDPAQELYVMLRGVGRDGEVGGPGYGVVSDPAAERPRLVEAAFAGGHEPAARWWARGHTGDLAVDACGDDPSRQNCRLSRS